MTDKIILIFWGVFATFCIAAILFAAGSYGVKNLKEAFWDKDTFNVVVHDTIYIQTKQCELDSLRECIRLSKKWLRHSVEDARKIDVYEQPIDSVAKYLLRFRKSLHKVRECLNDTTYLGPIDNYQKGYDDGYDDGWESARNDY